MSVMLYTPYQPRAVNLREPVNACQHTYKYCHQYTKFYLYWKRFNTLTAGVAYIRGFIFLAH